MKNLTPSDVASDYVHIFARCQSLTFSEGTFPKSIENNSKTFTKHEYKKKVDFSSFLRIIRLHRVGFEVFLCYEEKCSNSTFSGNGLRKYFIKMDLTAESSKSSVIANGLNIST